MRESRLKAPPSRAGSTARGCRSSTCRALHCGAALGLFECRGADALEAGISVCETCRRPSSRWRAPFRRRPPRSRSAPEAPIRSSECFSPNPGAGTTLMRKCNRVSWMIGASRAWGGRRGRSCRAIRPGRRPASGRRRTNAPPRIESWEGGVRRGMQDSPRRASSGRLARIGSKACPCSEGPCRACGPLAGADGNLRIVADPPRDAHCRQQRHRTVSAPARAGHKLRLAVSVP